MAFLDHEGGAEYPYERNVVFDALVKAIPTVSGLTVNNADRLGGHVLVKAGVSLMSWGENIPISVTEIAPGRTRVSITSAPKTGVLFGGAFDMGKNRKNIEDILGALSRVLSRLPPTRPQANTASSADTIQQLEKLGALKAQGILSETEFQEQKAKILGGTAAPRPATPRPTPMQRPSFRPNLTPPKNVDYSTIPCPACEKPIRVSTLVVGINACPHCGGEFIGE